jgi:hypothetical protein
LAAAIIEEPRAEYPIGAFLDELVVWQLGEFREGRALPGLERIAAFSASASNSAFGRTRASLVVVAGEAISKIREGTA